MKVLKTLILLGVVSVYAGAGQDSSSLSRLYGYLSNIDQKYAVMQDLVLLDDRSLEPFYVQSLNDLVYGNLSQYRVNKSTFDQWEALTRMIVMELGDIKGQSASSTVWDVARTTESSMLKAESLMALGRMGANEYEPEIATMLRNLNFNQRPDKENAEIEAFGAVVALSRMKGKAGYEPIFYASIGWYQDRVTELADKIIISSFQDPLTSLTTIIKNAQEYPAKRKVLETALRTDASPKEKVEILIVALQIGHKRNETVLSLKRQLAQLRKDAITAYITLDISHPDALDLLSKSIDRGELDERLIAIQALGTDGSEGAVEILGLRLRVYNDRQNSGVAINHDEELLVKQIIFALGETGSANALIALQGVKYTNYTPALKRLAQDVVKNIQGN